MSDAPEARARSPWRWWVLSGALAVTAWVAFIIAASGRDDVLAEAVLPDGTILRLNAVTFGSEHKYVVQKPTIGLHSLFGMGDPEISASAGFGELFPRCGVWLSRRDPETGEPLDLEWLSHCTAIDADGWEYATAFEGRCHWNAPTITTPYQESVVRDQTPFQSLPAGKYREIVVGAFLPLFRPKDGRFPLRVYNTAGEIVAEFDARYPGTPPVLEHWSPEPLPSTQTTGDLEVTLERIDWTPQTADLSDSNMRLTTLNVQPIVSLNWQGRPSEDWRLISENFVAVEDGLGNVSFVDRCRLTPNVPAWKLGLLLVRKAEARYATHEEWDSGPIELPPDGEVRELDLQGGVGELAVHVLKVFGPGSHGFTIAEPKCLGAISPPLEQEGSGWKVSAVHRPGNVDWSIESERPVVVWKQQPGEQLTRAGLMARAFDGDGEFVGVEDVYDVVYGNNTYITILKSSTTTGVISLKPAQTDLRNVSFLIEPPREVLASAGSGVAKPQASGRPDSQTGPD